MTSSDSKIVVLTGATYGLGKVMVEWFVNHGHIVIGCGRSKDKIENLQKQFDESTCKLSQVDVTDRKGLRQWARDSVSRFGSPDILINNAAIVNDPMKIWELPLETFDKIIDVNVKGVNNVIHYFLPSMIKSKKGVIINMSSGWGREGAANVTAYCCSKWGVEGYSSSLAKELPPPLSCVALNPGIINTLMLNQVFSQERCEQSDTPEEWALRACPMILSIDGHSNGQQLTVPYQ